MPEESILDQAIALIPGIGPKKKKSAARSTAAQLTSVQKNLAKLTKDLAKLTALMGRSAPAKKGKGVRAGKAAKFARSKRRGGGGGPKSK